MTESKLYSAAQSYLHHCPANDEIVGECVAEELLRDALRETHNLADYRNTPITLPWLVSIGFAYKEYATRVFLQVRCLMKLEYRQDLSCVILHQMGNYVSVPVATRGQMLDLLSLLGLTTEDTSCPA